MKLSRSARPMRSVATALFMCLSLAWLSGCGGGGGGESVATAGTSTVNDTGTVTVALTDAEGDFLSYTVDVLRIELLHSNGDVVQVLPATTRVDFVQLANLSELVSIATVPSGTYEQVRLLLDFSNASIVVQDAAGAAQLASVQDAAGNALTQLDVRLQLADRDRIRVTRAAALAFTIDFDLAASNTVSFAPAVVKVSPLLVATAALDGEREHRLRGLLDVVDQTGGTVTLTVRPHGSHGGRFGSSTFGVDADTIYEIDGRNLTGSAGLAALAALADDSLVVAQGPVVLQRLQADRVLAGTSVPGNGSDAVHGVVIARSGSLLTVRGLRAARGAEQHFKRELVEVTVGAGTQVRSRLDQSDLTEAALTVGALISVSGTLDSSGETDRLDASAARVQLHLSEAAGTVVSTSPLVLDLAYINGVRPAAFSFAGTGLVPVEDADPDAYAVDTTGLDTSGLAAGDVVRLRGIGNAFGQAPPDFDALSLTDVATERVGGALEVSWRASAGATAPFSTLAATGITLDLAGANARLHLRGIRRVRAEDVPLRLLPTSDGTGVYALHTRGVRDVRLFRTFAEFTDALRAALDGTRAAVRLSASGQYTAADDSLTVRRISVELVSRQ